MQVAAGGEVVDQLADELGLDQAALVVPLFVPGVRKIDVHPRQELWGHHVSKHLHGVVLDDAQVGQGLVVDQLEQGAHAGLVDFDANEVGVGARGGDGGGGATHAKANLQHRGGCAAEEGRPIGQSLHEWDHIARAELFQGPLLPAAHAARALDEALDGCAVRGLRCRRVVVAHEFGVGGRGPLATISARCGCSSMVERQLPKLHTRVRFPSPAPE